MVREWFMKHNFFAKRHKRVITPETINDPDPNEPAWLMITTSPIWTHEIQPFIEQLRDKALLDLLQAEPDKCAKLQGEASAYMKLMEFPARAADAEKRRLAELARKEEEEMNGPERSEPSWFARRSRTIRTTGTR